MPEDVDGVAGFIEDEGPAPPPEDEEPPRLDDSPPTFRLIMKSFFCMPKLMAS